MKTEQLYKLFKESKGIATDSRSIKKGEIFFAMWGENFNGNKYAAEALEKGASVAVVDDLLFETDKTILVDDCLLELQALASHYRKELGIPVIAITGTNGKTTTKELLATVLAKKFKVHYTPGNLNNHLGVPLTILSAPADTEMMIIEMGANHIGEIRTLCSVALPDYGIITNIGSAHIEGFGSFEGIVKAKTELYEYLRKVNGIAFYNDKNPLLTEKIFRIINRAIPFSDPTGIELNVEPLLSELNLVVSVSYKNHYFSLKTNLFGSYNIENVKTAIAMGLFFGVDINDIAAAVESYSPANNRSQVKKTIRNILICDSYNANPTSMCLALKSFDEISSGSRTVILGDMLELGEKSQEEHLRVLDYLRSLKIGKVFLVGRSFLKTAVSSGFSCFTDVNELAAFLKKEPLNGEIILVKGSRGIGLEKIYDLL